MQCPFTYTFRTDDSTSSKMNENGKSEIPIEVTPKHSLKKRLHPTSCPPDSGRMGAARHRKNLSFLSTWCLQDDAGHGRELNHGRKLMPSLQEWTSTGISVCTELLFPPLARECSAAVPIHTNAPVHGRKLNHGRKLMASLQEWTSTGISVCRNSFFRPRPQAPTPATIRARAWI